MSHPDWDAEGRARRDVSIPTGDPHITVRVLAGEVIPPRLRLRVVDAGPVALRPSSARHRKPRKD